MSEVAVSLTFASIAEFLLLTYPVDINTALLALTGSLWARGWDHLMPMLVLIPLIAMSLTLPRPGREIAAPPARERPHDKPATKYQKPTANTQTAIPEKERRGSLGIPTGSG